MVRVYCAQFVEIMPRVNITECARVKAVKDSSRELYRRVLSTSVWRIRTVPWTNGGETAASSAGSKSVSRLGWWRRLWGRMVSRVDEAVFQPNLGPSWSRVLLLPSLWSQLWSEHTWSQHQSWKTSTILR